MAQTEITSQPDYLTDLLETAETLFGPAAKQRVEEANEVRRRRASEDLAMARKIRRTFSSQHGRATLDWLRRMSLEAEPLTIDQLLAEKPEDRQLMAGSRAGMNEIYLLITIAIQQAENADPDNGDDDEA